MNKAFLNALSEHVKTDFDKHLLELLITSEKEKEIIETELRQVKETLAKVKKLVWA